MLDNVSKALRSVRRSLLAQGVSTERVDKAMSVATGEDYKLLSKMHMSRVLGRVRRALLRPGDRVTLIRGKNGVKVFSQAGLAKMRVNAKMNKPWLKSATGSKPTRVSYPADLADRLPLFKIWWMDPSRSNQAIADQFHLTVKQISLIGRSSGLPARRSMRCMYNNHLKNGAAPVVSIPGAIPV